MLRLLINLDRSPDRLQFMKTELSNLNLTFERIPAVDGKSLTVAQLQALTPKLYSKEKLWFPYNLINTEYACFLSHRCCWNRLLKSGEEFALVMEDDIKFIPESSVYLKDSSWIPNNVHLIQLHSPLKPQRFQIKNSEIIIDNNPPRTLYEIVHPTANGTPAYIISRKAAQIALDMSSLVGAPIDEFLFSPKSPFHKKINFHKIFPGLGFQIDTPSTILSQPRNRHKPFLCRLHPFSIWLKIHLLADKLKYTKEKDFFTSTNRTS